MTQKAILLFGLLLCLTGTAFGQRVAVKTNLLYGATATPNLAVEIGLGPRTTLELAGGYNDWKLNSEDKRLSHWLVQPEVRHWFCERFAGTFIGVHLHGGEFNVNRMNPFSILRNNRHEGWFAGVGIGVGHQWLLGKRLSLEAQIGVGYAYIDYERYGCAKCDPLEKAGSYNYFGPTRAAVSLVYFIW